MKTVKTVKTILFLSILFLVFSCNKDENTTPEEKTNSFAYKGTTYELGKGYYKTKPEGNYILYSIGITSSDVVNSQTGFTGQGELITLDLISSSNTVLTEGEYIYELGSETSMYCQLATVSIDYIFGVGGQQLIVMSGKANVSKEGDIYEITFDFILENDEKVSGYFKGSLTFNENL